MSGTPTVEVVVTGLGVTTPAGCTIGDFWTAIQSGRSTARALDDVGPPGTRYIGCRVAGLPAVDDSLSKDLRRSDPFTRFAVAAARAAVDHAAVPEVESYRGAVVVGNAVGGRTVSDREAGNYHRSGPSRVHPLMPIVTMPNAAAAQISIELGWRGPALTVATTCASGLDAVGLGVDLLRAGRADVVVAGGTEATLTPITLAAFTNFKAMSGRVDDPGAACRPFDRDRDGFVMGEGAGFLVLERRVDAEARGAVILGVLASHAATSDAQHLSAPDAAGSGAVAAMERAIHQAGLIPEDIAHINAHGTSTPLNDAAEAIAIRKVFGDVDVPVTATKGVIGHLIGAAGAVELVASVLTMNACLVPPTANHGSTSDEIDLDIVHGEPRAIDPGPVLANSFGFGGHNACVVVTPS